MSASDNVQNEATMALFEHYGWTKFAVLMSSSSYGSAGVATFISLALEKKWNILAYEEFQATPVFSEVNAIKELTRIKFSGKLHVYYNV